MNTQLLKQVRYIADKLDLQWYRVGEEKDYYIFEYKRGFKHRVKMFSDLQGLTNYIEGVYISL